MCSLASGFGEPVDRDGGGALARCSGVHLPSTNKFGFKGGYHGQVLMGTKNQLVGGCNCYMDPINHNDDDIRNCCCWRPYVRIDSIDTFQRTISKFGGGCRAHMRDSR